MKKHLAIFLVVLSFASFASADSRPIKFTLSAAAIGLGIADTMLTWHGTQHHGLYEQNNLFAPFFERGRRIDYFAVLNIQLAMSAAIVFACHALISMDSKPAKIAGYSILIATVVLRSYVCIRNARLNARAR
jgi:hypothetical protein